MNEANDWGIYAAALFGALVMLSAWAVSRETSEDGKPSPQRVRSFQPTLRAGILAVVFLALVGLAGYWIR